MKRAIAILFLCILSLQPLIKLGVLVSFKIHQDFIAKVLCINKKRVPTCKGSCHLRKELNKVDGSQDGNQTQTLPDPLKKNIEVLFFQKIQAIFIENTSFLKVYKQCHQHLIFSTGYLSEVFTPPQAFLV